MKQESTVIEAISSEIADEIIESTRTRRAKLTCSPPCGGCSHLNDPDRCVLAITADTKAMLGAMTRDAQGYATRTELTRLRRERIDQEAVNLEMGGELAKLRRELAETHSRLSVIVDEGLGIQEPLPLPGLLDRLERLLNERVRQHEGVRRELDEWKEWADYHSSWALIDAERPTDAELRARIGELCDVVTGEEWAKTNGERAKLRGERDEARAKLDELTRSAESAIVSLAENHAIAAEIVRTTRAERDEALARLELLDDHRRADSDLISRLESERDDYEGAEVNFKVALRDVEVADKIARDAKP